MTALEAALSRDRLWVLLGLGGAVALAWSWIAPMGADMYGRMDGASAWMMTARWDGAYSALMFGMWSVMMLGMMLPSAAAGILLYARVARSDAQSGSPLARTYLFAAGYLLAWTAFSAIATLLQWLLASLAVLTPMMESGSHRFSAGVLIAAGVYQWTPLKDVCLRQCRGPADFLARHWRRGMSGAVRMGFHHGLYCVGCCWVLMLLLFVGGVMNLVWIAAITVLVLVEKLAPPGVLAGRIVGLLMVAAGVLVLTR